MPVNICCKNHENHLPKSSAINGSILLDEFKSHSEIMKSFAGRNGKETGDSINVRIVKRIYFLVLLTRIGILV